ncbi:hypothetical protein NXX54_19100 [Bacteroides sp. BFG-638]|nr:hypothetical protein [Bacteroides sp. BFG-638]MCS2950338.1 hypothetical protein [Bacteroides sp. BFG-638]MCS3311620.1 hypothetical protein [Bacteroides sp. BFG-637]MCS3313942.1 hypothetical protein [Bacteroides sp. BFG-637]
MNDLTVVDSIYLDAQQKEDVRRLSSLGYSPKDIAVSLGLSLEDAGLFVRDAETVGTSVNFLIREGILVARAAPEIKLHGSGGRWKRGSYKTAGGRTEKTYFRTFNRTNG